MRATTTLRAVTSTALFLFLSVLASGQVRVINSLYREQICEPGETYDLEIEILNASETPQEVNITQKDIDFLNGQVKFLAPNSIGRSNSNFIQINSTRLLLKERRIAKLIFKVRVPSENELKEGLGSYYSLLMITANPFVKEVGTGKTMKIAVQYGIQVVTTVRENKEIEETKSLKISKVEVSEDHSKLILHLTNPGTEAVKALISPQLENVKPRRIRIFPGMSDTKEFDISHLEDKVYKDIRVVFDDEDVSLWAEKITFRKGDEPKKEKLTKLKGKKIRDRRTTTKPVRLYAVLNYGQNRKGLSFQGNANLGAFFLQANSNFSGYETMGNDIWRENYRIGTGYRNKNFRFDVSKSFFDNDRINTRFGGGIYFRNTSLNFGYYLENKITNVSVMQRIFKKYILRFHGSVSSFRNDWNFSLMIPIL